MTDNLTYHRGYLDGQHNRPNQAEIAGDDPRDTLDRRTYVRGYIAGVSLHQSSGATEMIYSYKEAAATVQDEDRAMLDDAARYEEREAEDDEWPTPPRINARRGATNENIEATREHIDLLGLKFLHLVEAAADAYRLATVAAIANHNENTYGPKTRPASFECGLADIMEGLAANLHSLTSDLTGDIADAPEE